MAGKRALGVRQQVGVGVRPDGVAQRVTEQVLRRHADQLAERAVGEPELLQQVAVDDRGTDAVGDQAQLVLALTGLELEPLQVVDVDDRDHDAADLAVGIALRVVIDAHPARRLPGHDQVTLETGALAGAGGVGVRPVERVDVQAVDLGDRPADEVTGLESQPLQEGGVGEAVAPVPIKAGDRQLDAVQHALRQPAKAPGAWRHRALPRRLAVASVPVGSLCQVVPMKFGCMPSVAPRSANTDAGRGQEANGAGKPGPPAR